MAKNFQLQKMQEIEDDLASRREVVFAFLFGSRARNDATEASDWDIAVWLADRLDPLEQAALAEDIRNAVAKTIKGPTDAVDVVILNRANLAIASTVVEEGLVLKGDRSLELARYYVRIWGLVEDFEWRLHNEPRPLPSGNASGLS